MYFIELVTTEHKLGITTLCIKKNLPPERNGSNLFLIYPTSHSLHRFHASHFRHSACLPALLPANVCRKLCNIVFISYYPEDLPGPLTPPIPPPTLPFYLLRLPLADAVISQAFNSLSHPLASRFFKSCLPLPFWMYSPCGCWYLLGGAAGDVKLCVGEEEKKKEEPTQGSEWWKEGGRERLSERLRGPTAIRLLFIFFLLFPKLTLLIFLTWNTASVEPSIVL